MIPEPDASVLLHRVLLCPRGGEGAAVVVIACVPLLLLTFVMFGGLCASALGAAVPGARGAAVVLL